ncbi:polysaccharide deacetylase family protein [Undibacterium sp. Ren11W]|uniref:polysaccharide deacetylase family protein n=1 Tax=Undibacterium sp. Ren11W TaxID=3413045 RepID=UPI003BF45391
MNVQKHPFNFTSNLIRIVGDCISLLGKESRVCVINYHRILSSKDSLLESEPDLATFTWHMEVLASRFNVLSLYDAIIAIQEDRVPPRAVCISFDDGYRSTHDLALPVLTRLSLPATVFVTTGFLSGGNMWNDRIVEAIRLLPNGPLDLEKVGMGMWDLAEQKERIKIVNFINDSCKYLTSEGRLRVILELERLSQPIQTSNLMLTREMVANLAQQGIEIGGHTITHPILTTLDDEAARYEINENKRVLEQIIQKPVRLFAYPNGKVGMDFDQRHRRMVQDAGYFASFTTGFGTLNKESNLFELPRRRPWDTNPLMFSLRLLSWLTTNGHVEKIQEKTSAIDNKQVQELKQTLLIAYHFPPQAGSSGIQRTLSFSKNLREQNWQATVLTVNPIAYESKNISQLSQLPENLKVRRAWALDVKRHFGIFGRYPELLALPDRWSSWWVCAIPLGLWIIYKNQVRVIWTTYPIATAHLIGLTLKFLTGKAWVADFRDPMTQDNYPQGKWQRKAFLWIERRTIERCDIAVFTTQSAREIYRQRFPQVSQKKFEVIENGYDEDGFDPLQFKNASLLDEEKSKISLLHSGELYSEGRDPTAFFKAIATLKLSGHLSADTLRIVLRAPGDEQYFIALVLQYGVDDMVFIEPHIAYQDALREMLSVDGLLVFQGTPFNTQIPAKIYEYFRARKPIFGLLDTCGETARALTAAGFHNVVNMASETDIQVGLERFLSQIKLKEAYTASDELVASSSRKYRAQQLARIFTKIAY